MKALPSLQSIAFPPRFPTGERWKKPRTRPALFSPCGKLTSFFVHLPQLAKFGFPTGITPLHKALFACNPPLLLVNLQVISRNKQEDAGAGSVPTSTSLQRWGWKGWRCRTGSWNVPSASLVALSATVRVRAGRERVSCQDEWGWPWDLGKGRVSEAMGRGLGKVWVMEGQMMGGLTPSQQPLCLTGHVEVNKDGT